MSAPRRVAFIHTGAVVIPMVAAEAATLLPGVEIVNYLDDRIVADLSRDEAPSVPARIAQLARAARDAGAEAVMLTCSSISTLAAPTAAAVGIPVLRIDEAMADAAVTAAGDGRVADLATLPTTCAPTAALLRDGRFAEAHVTGAAGGVMRRSGNPVRDERIDRHLRPVDLTEELAAAGADVVVLAQASMASAAAAAASTVPVLTSVALGVERLARTLDATGTEARA
ncbi:aspartate/glutamate racemase family protein [Microbacterium hominis]|uniref:aspartate/glutamate racemase family protein n=1 Tax=Microbacterium hominis TaxID=162426 RepID=UPI0007689575|nr:aspartate/glutamate racemase family protein [Microbacterium hominis]KXC07450.1 hypothetical protein MhomT_00060 [Microbacterium hominis]